MQVRLRFFLVFANYNCIFVEKSAKMMCFLQVFASKTSQDSFPYIFHFNLGDIKKHYFLFLLTINRLHSAFIIPSYLNHTVTTLSLLHGFNVLNHFFYKAFSRLYTSPANMWRHKDFALVLHLKEWIPLINWFTRYYI